MSGNAAFEKLDRPDSNDFSESENEYAAHNRTSEDVRRQDRETIGAEEEAERLLAGDEKSSRVERLFKRRADGGEQDAKRQRRKESRRLKRRKRKEGQESELMYDMEGGHRSSDDSSGHSSEVDLKRLAETQAKQKVGGS